MDGVMKLVVNLPERGSEFQSINAGEVMRHNSCCSFFFFFSLRFVESL